MASRLCALLFNHVLAPKETKTKVRVVFVLCMLPAAVWFVGHAPKPQEPKWFEHIPISEGMYMKLFVKVPLPAYFVDSLSIVSGENTLSNVNGGISICQLLSSGNKNSTMLEAIGQNATDEVINIIQSILTCF